MAWHTVRAIRVLRCAAFDRRRTVAGHLDPDDDYFALAFDLSGVSDVGLTSVTPATSQYRPRLTKR